jgi:prepilin-type N-terminal cleavage/methylation domain-containing protein
MKLGSFVRQKQLKEGFTIVELLTVVSVIVILAAIVLAVYPSYLTTTQDNARKSDIQQIASALSAYALKNNSFVDANSTDGSGNHCGFLGAGNGWFNAGPDAFFPASILACLKNSGVLKKDIIDPTGCTSDAPSGCSVSGATTAYMKATCTKGGVAATYVFARLVGQPRRDTEIDALCDAGTVSGFNSSSQKWGTNYGMNYYVTVK